MFDWVGGDWFGPGLGIEPLHWLRPLWLAGLLLVIPAWVIWAWRARQTHSRWRRQVDAALQPFVIERASGHRSLPGHGLFLAWGASLVLMAGPVWQRQPVPVFDAPQSQVILLDLSTSMLATDLAPDRLTRARFKLLDLLGAAQGMQMALVGFSERPYVISPLTDDAQTIIAFVPSLSPAIMPVQGSRPDLAIEQAVSLLEQAGIGHGHVILMTDAKPGARDISAAAALRQAGHRLSVWAVGTEEGAPLKDAAGQFLNAGTGQPVVPRIDPQAMSDLAAMGGGLFTPLTADGEDIARLSSIQSRLSTRSAEESEAAANEIYWVEYAPWALPLLLLGALSLFRRGTWS